MNSRALLPLSLAGLPLLAPVFSHAAESGRPNIVVIVSDDQGYADAGFMGSKEIPTPHLDRLAASGVRCTAGYVTHPYCSPSRAGLLTGRYQMRFGHERNPRAERADEGLPVSETLLPQHLKAAGYTTGWVGKWHLGAAPQFRPENRGFDQTFGFLGGGHYFLNWKPNPKSEYDWPVLRDGKEVAVKEHLTLALGRESADFVTRNKAQPWFLYVAYNAPHWPQQPTAERLAKFAHIRNPERRAYVAQVSLLDDAVGELTEALRRTGQDRNTLIFFLSDNGGPLRHSGANNGPLRGGKSMLYDGGIRVPFLVSWPAALPAGRDYDRPVSSLDIFTTSLAAAGVPMPTDKPYDGVNLVPHLAGRNPNDTHARLFWRATERGKRTWAVRSGDDKCVWVARHPWIFDSQDYCYAHDAAGDKAAWLIHAPYELYDFAQDLGERRDLGATSPAKVRDAVTAITDWERGGAPLAFPGPDGPDDGEHPALPAK